MQLLNNPIPKLDPWTGSNTIKQLHNNNVKEGSSLDSKENLEYPATENLKNFYSGFIEDIENNQVEKNEKSELEINEEEGNHFLDGFSIFPFKRSHKMVRLKQFVGKLPMNCLSVFAHFMELTLKGLTALYKIPGETKIPTTLRIGFRTLSNI